MKREKSISAVILAGGFGTRLSPLTDTRPKPLVKILDTPVLSAILKSVERLSPESITVSTHYKSENIERTVLEFCPRAVCKKESVPLGTAGAVKYCYNGNSDAVLVVSGDSVFDFDLQSAIDFHFDNNNDVTIVGCRKPDPTQYGVIVCDAENNIVSFCEKPSWKRVKSNLVNTGIYILSEETVEEIPDSMLYDFSKNLFPRLLKEGKRIKVFSPEGFWCDIGTLDEYFECNRLAASGSLKAAFGKGEDERKLRDRGIHAQDGCYVSSTVSVGKNVSITDGCVVCKNVHVGNNCDFSSCIVGEKSRIGNGSSISGSIVGENVCIGENCIVPEGCVIGDGCRIADGAVLKKHTRLAGRKCVFGEDCKMTRFSVTNNMFVDDGICTFDMACAQEDLLCLAKSVAVCFAKGEKRCACFSIVSDEGAEFLKGAYISGLMSEGGTVFDCGRGDRAICEYAAEKLDVSVSVHIKLCDNRVYVTLVTDKGKVINDETERKISRIFSLVRNGEQTACLAKKGKISFVPIWDMFESSAESFADRILGNGALDGISVCISDKTDASELLLRMLSRLDAKIVEKSDGDAVCITQSPDGKYLSVRYSNTILDHNHISAIILKNKHLLELENVALEPDAPSSLLRLAGETEIITDFSERFVLKNSVMTAISLLAVCKKRKMNVKELFEELMPFEVYTEQYVADVNKGETVEKLSRLYSGTGNTSGDGIRLSLADGVVTVIPNRAKGFKLITESVSMEAAKELSRRIGNIIKGKE